ncbi:MAG: SDR family NAD(P)-dependent oxidoreductase [Bryobacteraceae bacterium]
MPDLLAGKQVIIAGGSGGLGSGTTELLAAEGADLIISYASNAARASRYRDVARIVRADITSAADRKSLLDAAPNLYGLVVFSGESAREKELSRLQEATRRSHEVNFLGPVMLAREAAAHMKAAGMPGAILLISTMQAVSVFPNSTAYAAPKAALVHAALILAKENRGKPNIRVNTVCPGVHAAGIAAETIAAGKYDRYLEDGSVHRWGQPADVAKAVRFFLEPDNYVTGQVLTIDGGLTL